MLGRWFRRQPADELAQARALAVGGRPAEAVVIWTRLAEAGNSRAQTNLGACHANGLGTPVDPAAARHWLQRGAQSGDMLGQRNLGTLLLPEDREAAAVWYRKAAEAGDVISQDQLSRLLLDGADEDGAWAEARDWALRAAQAGNAPAAHRLATMCHEAKGGPRDPAQAARWWRVAAEAGNGDAAAMLGAAYHMGQGVAADPVEAMAWLRVGSARHSTLVRPFYARAEAALTPGQAAQAAALAETRLSPGPSPAPDRAR